MQFAGARASFSINERNCRRRESASTASIKTHANIRKYSPHTKNRFSSTAVKRSHDLNSPTTTTTITSAATTTNDAVVVQRLYVNIYANFLRAIVHAEKLHARGARTLAEHSRIIERIHTHPLHASTCVCTYTNMLAQKLAKRSTT